MSSASPYTAGPDASPGNRRTSSPLSLRLILMFFSAAFLLVAAASCVLYQGTIAALQGADDQVVDKRAAMIEGLLTQREFNEGLLLHEVNDDNQGPRQIFIRVVTAAKEANVETEGMSAVLAPGVFPKPQLPGDVVRQTFISPAGKIYRMSSRTVSITGLSGNPSAIIQVATDTSLDQDALARFRHTLFGVIGAALPLCALVAYMLVRRELTPLARISAATRAIDATSIGQRLHFGPLPAELDDLARQFNAMLDRLENAWKDLEHYADTIAHEMRTPLNRMRLNCEIAASTSESAEELREVMIANVAECERLTRLLNGLLFLARADSQRAGQTFERIDPAEHIRIVHEFFKADAEERGISFIADCQQTPPITADRDLFKQAITNLVSNALAHTPRGGSVTVGCDVKDHEVRIRVSDTGRGIKDADKPRIFERFYRASPAANSEGLGLGLAITKGIATLHGGRITFESTHSQGTTFTLAFPSA